MGLWRLSSGIARIPTRSHLLSQFRSNLHQDPPQVFRHYSLACLYGRQRPSMLHSDQCWVGAWRPCILTHTPAISYVQIAKIRVPQEQTKLC